MSPEETFSLAAQLLRDGQSLEAQVSPDALTAAVRCYEQAIAALRTLPLADTRVRHELAVAAMNRGNACQRQNTPAARPEALRSYDEAIAFFRTLPLDEHPDFRNSLGAAWMNRGHALYLQAEPAAMTEAVRSQREAVSILSTLPLEAHRSYRINLAAAWMNQANALLALQENEPAADAARESGRIAAPAEAEDPVVADIGLKARRALCEAIGRLLAPTHGFVRNTEILADEASDVVDDGLALARRWQSRGVPHFRALAARLFHFGAQLYRVHLPDFLAEFLLEHIDPEQSEGAMTDEAFYLIAQESLGLARQDLEARRTVFLDTPETAQLLQRFRDVRAAEQRVAELRARFAPSSATEA